MNITESLKQCRSYYHINKILPVSEETIIEQIKEITELVPDAYNMKSSIIVVALNEQHDQLWDMIYEAFNGKISREKIDSFKAGAGTILYFYDQQVIEAMQQQFPLYADNFPVWANQASGMLQLSLWSGLRELGIGASLQHYNPIIDEQVHELFALPKQYKLIAQMPFGGIGTEAIAKPKEDINQRVLIRR